MTVAIDDYVVNNSTAFKSEGASSGTLSGIAMIILAYSNNYDAIQGLSMKGMSLGATLAKQQQKEAAAAIEAMGGNDPVGKCDLTKREDQQANPMQAINWVLAQGWTWRDVTEMKVSIHTSELNTLNTKFNQMNTNYNGIIQGVNQNSADMTSTLGLITDMEGTNGVLATLQTIAQLA